MILFMCIYIYIYIEREREREREIILYVHRARVGQATTTRPRTLATHLAPAPNYIKIIRYLHLITNTTITKH